VHVSTDEVYGSLGASGRLARALPISPVHLTLPARRLPITSRSHGTKPMICRSSCRIARITMDLASSPRSLFR
jgi:hypothetical protein